MRDLVNAQLSDDATDSGYSRIIFAIVGRTIRINNVRWIDLHWAKFVHIKNLEKNGYIETTNNKFRTISLLVDNEYLEKNDDVIKVPLLGKVTAGSPITAIETPNEFFDLPASLVPKNEEVFTLHVSGESMINAGIFDGDIIIVERQSTARNGEIVVAMTDDNEVTLKTFYKENGYFRLQPENNTMQPFIFDNITILGKAIGLYRKI